MSRTAPLAYRQECKIRKIWESLCCSRMHTQSVSIFRRCSVRVSAWTPSVLPNKRWIAPLLKEDPFLLDPCYSSPVVLPFNATYGSANGGPRSGEVMRAVLGLFPPRFAEGRVICVQLCDRLLWPCLVPQPPAAMVSLFWIRSQSLISRGNKATVKQHLNTRVQKAQTGRGTICTPMKCAKRISSAFIVIGLGRWP
jgi:hypothetical protein